jgi:hypothetical protein
MNCLNCNKSAGATFSNLCIDCINRLLDLLVNDTGTKRCTRCNSESDIEALLVVQSELGVMYVCTLCIDSIIESYRDDNPNFDPIQFLLDEFKNSKVGKFLKKYNDQLKG